MTVNSKQYKTLLLKVHVDIIQTSFPCLLRDDVVDLSPECLQMWSSIFLFTMTQFPKFAPRFGFIKL